MKSVGHYTNRKQVQSQQVQTGEATAGEKMASSRGDI